MQDTLLSLAKAVANATAALVLKAKNVASKTEDQGLQNRVISSATQCALATSQLVACTKVTTSLNSHLPSGDCHRDLVDRASAQREEGRWFDTRPHPTERRLKSVLVISC